MQYTLEFVFCFRDDLNARINWEDQMLDWDVPATDFMSTYPETNDGVHPTTEWFKPDTSYFDDFGPMYSGSSSSDPWVDEVVVTGPGDDPFDDWWEQFGPGQSGGPGTGPGGGGGGGAGGPNVDGLTPHQGLQCASNEIKEAINDLSTNDTNEHVAIVFRGPDGQLYTSPPFVGAAGSVAWGALGQWMAAHNVNFSDVEGLYHNHPTTTSTNPDPDLHRYPSNSNSVLPGQPNDWGVATMWVGFGANPARFTLIVEDQNGVARQFPYADRAQYENMTVQEMEQAANLPGGVAAC